MIVSRQSTARTVMVGPILDADGVAVTTAVVGNLKLSKNGGIPAALDGSATLAHRHTGHYSLALTANDLDTVGQAEVVIDDTVNAMPAKELTVIEEAVYDALFASGAAGYQVPIWSSAGATVNLSATTVNLVNTVTTYTGNTPQTGDAFARLGAPAGASVSADIAAIEAQTDDIGAAGAGLTAVPWNPAWDAEVESEVADALTAFGASTLTAAAAADAVWDEVMAGHVAAGSFGMLGTWLAALYSAEIGYLGTVDDAAATDSAFDTTLTGVDGFWNDTTLTFTGGALAGQTRVIVSYVALNGRVTFDEPFTSAPANGIDFTVKIGHTHSRSQIAAAVWDKLIADHLSAGSTGEALNAAGAAGDPWTTALPGAYGAGSAGFIIGTNINATISSRATQTSVDDVPTNAELAAALAAADDAVLAAVAAVQADTDNIQTRLPAALTVDNLLKVDILAVNGGPPDGLQTLSNDYGNNELFASVTSVTGNIGGNVLGGVTGLVGGIAGTITTLDALDTAQDAQHAATLAAIADVPTNAELATALGDLPTADENADALLLRSADGGSVASVSGKRSVAFYLQGGLPVVTQNAAGTTYSILGADGVTVLSTGAFARLSTAVGGVEDITPA